MSNFPETRRGFVKKAAYVAPVIMTLAAAPSFAKSGSDKGHEGGGNDDKGEKFKGEKLKPPKLPGKDD